MRPPPDSWPAPIQLESLGPGLLANDEVARLWDTVALTEAEDLAIQVLRLVVGETLERLAVVGEGSTSYPPPGAPRRREAHFLRGAHPLEATR